MYLLHRAGNMTPEKTHGATTDHDESPLNALLFCDSPIVQAQQTSISDHPQMPSQPHYKTFAVRSHSRRATQSSASVRHRFVVPVTQQQLLDECFFLLVITSVARQVGRLVFNLMNAKAATWHASWSTVQYST